MPRTVSTIPIGTPIPEQLRLLGCRHLHDAARRPVAVWQWTDRTVPRVSPHRGVPDGPLLALDRADEVAARFDDPEEGFSYGICWRYESDRTLQAGRRGG